MIMKTDHSDSISKLLGQWKLLLEDSPTPVVRRLRVHYDDYTPDQGVVLDDESGKFLFHIDWSSNLELLDFAKDHKGGVVLSYDGGFEELFKAMNPGPASFSIRFNGEKK